MNGEVQGVDEPMAIGSKCGAGNRLANGRFDCRPNPMAEFADEKRKTERQAVTADEVKQRRVLAFEIDRQHGRLRLLNQAHDELFSRQFLRCAEGLLRRCDTARRKNDDHHTLFQELARLRACRKVGCKGTLRSREIDRQSKPLDFG